MSFHDARLEQLQREIARKRQLEAQREQEKAELAAERERLEAERRSKYPELQTCIFKVTNVGCSLITTLRDHERDVLQRVA